MKLRAIYGCCCLAVTALIAIIFLTYGGVHEYVVSYSASIPGGRIEGNANYIGKLKSWNDHQRMTEEIRARLTNVTAVTIHDIYKLR